MSINIDPSNPTPNASTASSDSFTLISPVDTLSSATQSTVTSNNGIELDPPSLSLVDFFSAIATSLTEFQRQLAESNLVDQLRSRFLSLPALGMPLLSDFTNLISMNVDYVNATVEAFSNTLNLKIDGANNLIIAEQAAIRDVNQRATTNDTDANHVQTALSAFSQVYDAANNISSPPNNPLNDNTTQTSYFQSNYYTDPSIPNAVATDVDNYNTTINAYNDYVAARNTQIATYDQATSQYNANVTQFNQSMVSFLSQYGMLDYVNQQGIDLMMTSVSTINYQLPTAQLATYTEGSTSDIPPQYYINVNLPYKPSSWTQTNYLGIDGITDNPTYNSNSNLVNQLSNVLFNQLTATYVTPLKDSYGAFLALISHENLVARSHNNQNMQKADPFTLFEKPLVNRTQPNTIIEQNDPAIQSNTGANPLTVQSAGLGSGDLVDQALNKAAFKQFVYNSLILQQLDSNTKDQFIDKLENLNTSTIKSTAFLSTFPALSQVTANLKSLTPDSPAFPLLLATSFTNLVNEQVQKGTTTNTLLQFLNASPELANLSDSDKVALAEGLTPLFNTSLSLVSLSLLTNSLGLKALPIQLLGLLSVVNSEDLQALTDQASQAQLKELKSIQDQFSQTFIAQGFDSETAQFLAQFETQVMGAGITTPTATTISSSTVQVDLLTNSLIASLVLSGKDLQTARAIASKAITATLGKGIPLSQGAFISALEANLLKLGLGSKSASIAANVITLIGSDNPLQVAAPLLPISQVPLSVGFVPLPTLIQNRLDKIKMAQFMAQFGISSDQAVPSISPSTVQIEWVTRALATALLLNGLDPKAAEKIAEQAVKGTLAGGPFASFTDFANTLRTQLTRLGIAPSDISLLVASLTGENPKISPFSPFSAESIQFLSDFSESLAALDQTTPSLLATISPTTVQMNVLTDSLITTLILNGKDLRPAQKLANQALANTFAGGDFSSLTTFATSLEKNLRQLGVNHLKAPEIAVGLVILPGAQNPLETPTPTLPGSKDIISVGLPASASLIIDRLNAIPPNLAKAVQGQLNLSNPVNRDIVVQEIKTTLLKQGFDEQAADLIAQTTAELVRQAQAEDIIRQEVRAQSNRNYNRQDQIAQSDTSPPPDLTQTYQPEDYTQPAPVELNTPYQPSDEELALKATPTPNPAVDEKRPVSPPTKPTSPPIDTTKAPYSGLTASQIQLIRDIIASIILLKQNQTTAIMEMVNRIAEVIIAQAQNLTLLRAELARLLAGFDLNQATMQDILTNASLLAALATPKITLPVVTPLPNVTPPEVQQQILKEDILRHAIQKRVIEILQPLLGAKLATSISAEVAKALFGTPTPDSADKADVKKPLSLVNSLHLTLRDFKKQNADIYASEQDKLFQTFIQKSVSLDTFLLDVMDPANLFLYGLPSAGIMYGGSTPSNFKKSTDMPFLA
jgi:hypothetical protein